MKVTKYLIGLMGGLTFGMLFAPKKGDKLRKELKDKCMDPSKYKDGVKVLGGAIKLAGKDAVKELKKFSKNEQVAAFLDLSQDKMKEFLENAEDKGYDLAGFVQEKLESLAKVAKEKADNTENLIDSTKPIAIKKVKKIKKNVKFAKRKLKSTVKSIKKDIKDIKKTVNKNKDTVKKPAKKKMKKANIKIEPKSTIDFTNKNIKANTLKNSKKTSAKKSIKKKTTVKKPKK